MACCSRMQCSGSLCDGGKTTCSEMDSSQLPHKAFFCFTVFLLACSILHYNTDDYYHIIFLDSSLEAFKTHSLCWPPTVISCVFTVVVLVCTFYCFIRPCCRFADSFLWLYGLLTWELLLCTSHESWLTQLLVLASIGACIQDGCISVL